MPKPFTSQELREALTGYLTSARPCVRDCYVYHRLAGCSHSEAAQNADNDLDSWDAASSQLIDVAARAFEGKGRLEEIK